MAIVFTAHCRLSGGAALCSPRTQIIINPSRIHRPSPVQSSVCSTLLAHTPTPTPPVQAGDDHTQAQATTRRSRLRETTSDPCWIVFIPYRSRTSSHPEPVQPGQPSAHQCASVSQLPSSPVVRPVRPVPRASTPCPPFTRLSTSSAVSSRLVPCHRPRLRCNLAPIWSCHSIFTALPTPDSVACLLARYLATRQSHAGLSPAPTTPSHSLAGSQDTSNCLGHLA